jgi:MFS family permease
VLQDAYKISASTTGLLLFPVAICDFVAINMAGRGYNRFGPRPFAVAGLLFLFGTAVALSLINEGTNEYVIAGISALRGCGMGFCMMPVQTMAFNTVPRDQMPRATALSNVMMRVFGSASTAMLTTIVVISLTFHGAPDGASMSSPDLAPGILLSSFKDAFMAMAIVSATGLIFAYFIHDDVLKTHRAEEASKEEALEAVLAEG